MSMVLDAQILRETLMSIPEVTDIVGMGGEYKIFWESVDEDVPFPYIVVSYLYGGYDTQNYPSLAAERVYRVTGFTGSRLTSLELAKAIHKLNRLWPVVNEDLPACGFSHITEESAFYEMYKVQNVKVFEVGGYYRLPISYEGIV